MVFPSLPLLRAVLLLQSTGNSFRIVPRTFWLQFLLLHHPRGPSGCCWNGGWIRDGGSGRCTHTRQSKRSLPHCQALLRIKAITTTTLTFKSLGKGSCCKHQSDRSTTSEPLMLTRTGSLSAVLQKLWHKGDGLPAHPTSLPCPHEAMEWLLWEHRTLPHPGKDNWNWRSGTCQGCRSTGDHCAKGSQQSSRRNRNLWCTLSSEFCL